MLGASGRFEPDKKLSREELAVVLRRVLDLPDANVSGFTDYNKISDWAKSSVGAVSENGIMVGSNGEFRPGAAVSREEAAAIFVGCTKRSVKNKNAGRVKNAAESFIVTYSRFACFPAGVLRRAGSGHDRK